MGSHTQQHCPGNISRQNTSFGDKKHVFPQQHLIPNIFRLIFLCQFRCDRNKIDWTSTDKYPLTIGLNPVKVLTLTFIAGTSMGIHWVKQHCFWYTGITCTIFWQGWVSHYSARNPIHRYNKHKLVSKIRAVNYLPSQLIDHST